MMSPTACYAIGAAFAGLGLAVTWLRYARPGAPEPS